VKRGKGDKGGGQHAKGGVGVPCVGRGNGGGGKRWRDALCVIAFVLLRLRGDASAPPASLVGCCSCPRRHESRLRPMRRMRRANPKPSRRRQRVRALRPRLPPAPPHIGTAGFCVGSRLKRFLHVIRSCVRRQGPRVSAPPVNATHTHACAAAAGGARWRRTRENLSSGEKRAGCADCVGLPSGPSFCASARRAACAWTRQPPRRFSCVRAQQNAHANERRVP
jgi:hypothetical protein